MPLPIVTPLVHGLILFTMMMVIGLVVTGRLVDDAAAEFDPASQATIAGWLQRLPSLLAWFLLMLTLIRGALQLLAFSDPGAPPDSELVAAVLTAGAWGKAWMAELAAAFIMLALAWLFARRPRAQRRAVAVTGAVLVVAEAGMGHGVEALWQPLWLGRLVHATHLLGGGLWIGTLTVLALTVIPSLWVHDARRALALIIARFSRSARAGALLLVASGVVATWRYTGRLLDLPDAAWGRLLLIKLVILLGVMALGWYNWRVVTPRLEQEERAAAARLRRSVVIELALAIAIVAVTALLVSQPLPIDLTG